MDLHRIYAITRINVTWLSFISVSLIAADPIAVEGIVVWQLSANRNNLPVYSDPKSIIRPDNEVRSNCEPMD